MHNIALLIYELHSDNKNRLFVMREDLIPFSFGGNKVRIAEKYFEDMKRCGKDCMVAYGNARSNLCRILSNLCATEGVPCHIIAPADDDGTRHVTNNQRLVSQCGATIHECSKQDVHDAVEQVLQDCVSMGMNPYYIYGNAYGEGNEAVPVSAYYEVYQQLVIKGNFDYIFLPVGTGMTMAGLLAGKIAQNGKERIIGISIARSRELATQKTETFLKAYLNQPQKHFTEQIEIIAEYIEGGYGLYHSGIVNTIFDVYRQYGIPLDPVYTGKAFFGMMDYTEKHHIHDKNLLFIHTGGIPLFFDLLANIQAGLADFAHVEGKRGMRA